MSEARHRLNKIIDDYGLNIGHVLPYDSKDRAYFRVIDASLAKLDATPTREQIMSDERVQALVEAAYLAGFNATGEGYNAEWPFLDYGKDPEDDADWIADRDKALAALTESP